MSEERGQPLSPAQFREVMMRQAMEAEQAAVAEAEAAQTANGEGETRQDQSGAIPDPHQWNPQDFPKVQAQLPQMPEFSMRDGMYLAGGLVVGGLVVVYLLYRKPEALGGGAGAETGDAS